MNSNATTNLQINKNITNFEQKNNSEINTLDLVEEDDKAYNFEKMLEEYNEKDYNEFFNYYNGIDADIIFNQTIEGNKKENENKYNDGLKQIDNKEFEEDGFNNKDDDGDKVNDDDDEENDDEDYEKFEQMLKIMVDQYLMDKENNKNDKEKFQLSFKPIEVKLRHKPKYFLKLNETPNCTRELQMLQPRGHDTNLIAQSSSQPADIKQSINEVSNSGTFQMSYFASLVCFMIVFLVLYCLFKAILFVVKKCRSKKKVRFDGTDIIYESI